MSNKIYTPAGYEYDEPVLAGEPDVDIQLSYADAFDVVLDAIESEASIEPLTPPTFKVLAAQVLSALVDTSDESSEKDMKDLEAANLELGQYMLENFLSGLEYLGLVAVTSGHDSVDSDTVICVAP